MRGASPKGWRPPFFQTCGSIAIVSMVYVIVHMYQVIGNLHHEQQVMREQLLSLTGFSGSDGGVGERKRLRAGGPNANVEAFLYAAGEEEEERQPRRMAAALTIGQTKGVGCYQLNDAATNSFDVSSATACNTYNCPDCFVYPSTASTASVTLTVQSCSTAVWLSSRSQLRTGIWAYTFINTHASAVLSVTDNSGSGITFKVPAQSFVQAYCSDSLGVQDMLFFPSTTLPTLSVDSGFTLSAGNFDASSSTGTFQTSTGAITLGGDTTISGAGAFTTGTGAVALNGATTVAASKAFTVGTAGSGGATTLYGNVVIGDSGSGNSVSTTIYGHITQNDDADGTASTFNTGTGSISLDGDVSVALGKNLHMASGGSGTFQTGTGAVSLYGDTTVQGTKSFTSGSGTVSLNGNTQVANSMTFSVGTTAGSGGASTFYGNVNMGGSGTGEAVTQTLYGSFTQNDDFDGTFINFQTATGAISINGDVTIASGKNLHMTSSGGGSFQTGTGSVGLNGNVAIAGSNTFTTGTGDVSLNGKTTVGGGKNFAVGSAAGAGGTTQLFGDVYIGDNTNGNTQTLTVYGDVSFNDDSDGTVKTFTTGTGAITLNGDVALAQDKNLLMHSGGTGQFQTGTGTVSLNGDTTVKTAKTFTLATYTSPVVCNNADTGAGATYCTSTR